MRDAAALKGGEFREMLERRSKREVAGFFFGLGGQGGEDFSGRYFWEVLLRERDLLS